MNSLILQVHIIKDYIFDNYLTKKFLFLKHSFMKYNLSNKSILILGAEDEYLKPSQVFLGDADVSENTGGKFKA